MTPPISNHLIAALATPERARLLQGLTVVPVEFGDVLAEPGEILPWVYFPVSAFISLIACVDGQPRLEVGLVGAEGMLGATVALGGDTSPTHAVVQGSGSVLRMDVMAFRAELARSPSLQSVLFCNIRGGIEQLAQAAICARFHAVEARLARWLLMTGDRAHADTFQITHEFIAYMLGVRRAGITASASAFQKRGLIHYRRGSLTILDRAGLEAVACACYVTDRAIHDRTMYPQAHDGHT